MINKNNDIQKISRLKVIKDVILYHILIVGNGIERRNLF